MEFQMGSKFVLHIPGLEIQGVQDPHGQVPARVEVTRVKTYERNPRRSQNPEYDRIRASIRECGLEQPLVITRRPHESDFVVCAGGNTRLRILQQLCQQTGEERFCMAQCLYRPWTCESDVLLAHLKENDLRARLNLIDRALAVVDAKTLLSEELGKPVSVRRLEAKLRRAGYHISHSRISQMEYAVRTLLPCIPQALEGGIGWRQVTRIRSLERAAAMLWAQYCPEYEGEFEEMFAQLCQRYDSPDWDINPLIGGLENEISQGSDHQLQVVRLVLDAAIKGREVIIPELDPLAPGGADAASEAAATGTDAAGRQEAEAPAQSIPARPGTPERPGSARDRDIAYELAMEAANAGLNTFNLGALRSRAYDLAWQLARCCGISELVLRLPDRGLGYLLRDIPDSQACPEGVRPEQVRILWWQLVTCSEVTVAHPDEVAPGLPADSRLRKAIETRDIDSLERQVPVPGFGHTGSCLWRKLHEQDWNDLIRLMDNYRRIRKGAKAAGMTLWEKAP